MACKFKHANMTMLYGQKQPPEVFYKKGVLRNFTKFTPKHLCQSLFFNKVAGLRPFCNKKENMPQVLSCEFYEYLFYRTLRKILDQQTSGCRIQPLNKP